MYRLSSISGFTEGGDTGFASGHSSNKQFPTLHQTVNVPLARNEVGILVHVDPETTRVRVQHSLHRLQSLNPICL